MQYSNEMDTTSNNESHRDDSSDLIHSSPVKTHAQEYENVDSEKASSKQYTFEDLCHAVKYGFKVQVQRILESDASFINNHDSEGFSCIHWACKKDSIEILEILANFGGDLKQVTSCEAKMCPIHWAASDGRIAIINYLISKRQDINVLDANMCTPVIIATQHNQIATIVFLMKNGANMGHKDINGDTALHWAAYKGYTELLAFLAYNMPQDINSLDTFGQSPVHLAALQGQYGCVDYLANECHVDMLTKDKNGCSPLDLSIKKNSPRTEWLIRQIMSKSILDLVNGLTLARLKHPLFLQFLFFGSNDEEYGRWAWRIVFLSNFIGSIVTMVIAFDENMSDLYFLHQISTMIQFFWWIMFFMCLFKSPGIVVDETRENGKYSYETALNIIVDLDSREEKPSICHTCRVRRPFRSKHCKILKKCIHKFDHFCPFVGNTVGRDNYKYFIALLVSHMIAGSLFILTCFILWRRTNISWMLTFFILYFCCWELMIIMLLQYHLRLVSSNLTTNEFINVQKYSYLHGEFNTFDNPFDKGSFWENFLDIVTPSAISAFSRVNRIQTV